MGSNTTWLSNLTGVADSILGTNGKAEVEPITQQQKRAELFAEAYSDAHANARDADWDEFARSPTEQDRAAIAFADASAAIGDMPTELRESAVYWLIGQVHAINALERMAGESITDSIAGM